MSDTWACIWLIVGAIGLSMLYIACLYWSAQNFLFAVRNVIASCARVERARRAPLPEDVQEILRKNGIAVDAHGWPQFRDDD